MSANDNSKTTKPVFLRLPSDLHKVLSSRARKRKTTIQKEIIRTIDERTK